MNQGSTLCAVVESRNIACDKLSMCSLWCIIVSSKVAALLTSRPEEITQITIERNASGLQVKPNLSSRTISESSDSEPESSSDDKSFRHRSVSLGFTRRRLRRAGKSTPTTYHKNTVQTGETNLDDNGNIKKTKPAMRSNSLPRR